MKITFEQRQQVRTEEMEALRSLERSMIGLKAAYAKLGETAGLATEATQSCIELLNEHIESRADSL